MDTLDSIARILGMMVMTIGGIGVWFMIFLWTFNKTRIVRDVVIGYRYYLLSKRPAPKPEGEK